MFIEDDPEPPWYQARSIGMRYINLFVVDEDDQFEIAAIYELSYTGGKVEEKIETAMQAVTQLRQHQKEGSEYFIAKYVFSQA